VFYTEARTLGGETREFASRLFLGCCLSVLGNVADDIPCAMISSPCASLQRRSAIWASPNLQARETTPEMAGRDCRSNEEMETPAEKRASRFSRTNDAGAVRE